MNNCQVSSHDERQERAAAVLAAAGKKLDVGSLGTTTPVTPGHQCHSSHLGTITYPRSNRCRHCWKKLIFYFSQGGIWISSLEGNHPSKKFAVVWQLINVINCFFFKSFINFDPRFSKFISWNWCYSLVLHQKPMQDAPLPVVKKWLTYNSTYEGWIHPMLSIYKANL